MLDASLASLRSPLQRTYRLLLRIPALRFLRRLTIRVPFSRFHGLASWLFWGEKIIEWRGVRVAVNPGEVHGYYPYFLDDYSGIALGARSHLMAVRSA